MDAGDPVEQAAVYDAAGADELCFLDITASHEGRKTIFDIVRRTAERCFMPLTVGGGVRTTEDIRKLLLAGADKVSINTQAVIDPELVRAGAKKFGSQCIVVAIDAKRIGDQFDRDGTKQGFDIALTSAVSDAVPVPVIASGGVGTLDHLVDGVRDGHASAVLAASIFHFGTFTIAEAKTYMEAAGVAMRNADEGQS